MKVSLLTIGTEITTGEILNSNVQWMSQRLEDLGLDVAHHLTVPDHFNVMLSALDYLSTSEVLILTGGLGPTQDDLTREVVSRWTNLSLKFSDEAWKHLESYMEKRQRKPFEAHRHQCFFPEGSLALKNDVGTAFGFLCEGLFGQKTKKLFCLPGPPRELYPMWESEVSERLPKGSLTPWVKWVFEGLPESEVADRFERVLSFFVDPKQLDIGYRASPPLVHVKLRRAQIPKGFEEKIEQEFSKFLKK